MIVPTDSFAMAVKSQRINKFRMEEKNGTMNAFNKRKNQDDFGLFFFFYKGKDSTIGNVSREGGGYRL